MDDRTDEYQDQSIELRPFFKGTILENGYGYIPKDIATNNTISLKARGLYAYFASFAGQSKKAWPSREKIKFDCEIKDNKTFYKLLHELKAMGYLKTEKRRDPITQTWENTIYILCLTQQEIEEAKNAYASEISDKDTDCKTPNNDIPEPWGKKSTMAIDEPDGKKAMVEKSHRGENPPLKETVSLKETNLSYFNNKKEMAATNETKIGNEITYVSCIRFWEKNKGRLMNALEVEKIADMINRTSPELVQEAMNEALLNENTGIKYVSGIIENWILKGIRTIEQVEQERSRFKNRKQKKAELDDKTLDLREKNQEVWEKEIDQRAARVKQIDKDQKKKTSGVPLGGSPYQEFEIYVPPELMAELKAKEESQKKENQSTDEML